MNTYISVLKFQKPESIIRNINDLPRQAHDYLAGLLLQYTLQHNNYRYIRTRRHPARL